MPGRNLRAKARHPGETRGDAASNPGTLIVIVAEIVDPTIETGEDRRETQSAACCVACGTEVRSGGRDWGKRRVLALVMVDNAVAPGELGRMVLGGPLSVR